MSVPVSRRVQRVKPSPTLAVAARAARLKAEGHDIIGLGVGEPDFDTPKHIADAGVAAIRSGFTRYTAVEGINELKDAIIGKFRRDNGLEYSRAQILVSSGAKQTVYNLCAAILDPDDEADHPGALLGLLPRHGPALGRQASDRVRRTQTRATRSRPPNWRRAITPRTRLLLLNSPCNPTGAAYTRAELVALGDVLLAHPRIVIGTDDMYEHIYWAQRAVLQPAHRGTRAL